MENKAWIIAVNMGYGHQRTAFPLRDFAPDGKIIYANDYEEIPSKDRRIWESARKFYEAISRFKRIPLLGDFSFTLFDQFQKILEFYPKRDLSKPNFSLMRNFSLIKNGWGEHLIKKISLTDDSLPLITTFFLPAFMAENFNYPGEIYCIVCDADISRVWASLNPFQSRIKYFIPNQRVGERLKLYGIKSKNIFLTGYPLPLENIGSQNLEILKEDFGFRLLNLDPKGRFQKYYEPLIKKHLGKLPEKSDHKLTIMFSLGGAGAQKEIGAKILRSLRLKIMQGELKIIFSAGVKERIKGYFEKEIKKMNLGNFLGKEIEILYQEKIEDYFREFNKALRKTDILWTKPSELSFYSALGIPIIVAPTIGSQEEFNKRWLLKSGFGILQENPSYAHQWLFDWLDQGYLAEAAMQGFIEAEKLGSLRIQEIISKKK